MSNVIDITKDIKLRELDTHNRKLMIDVYKLRQQLAAANHANKLLIHENELLKKYNEVFMEGFKVP